MTARSEQVSPEAAAAERRQQLPTRDDVNVGRVGRLSSLALGGPLLGYGLQRRRSLRGAVSALAGSYLLYRGASGHCRFFESMDVNTARRHRALEPGASADALEVERSTTVDLDAEELHEYWTDPEQLTQIAGDFADVRTAGAERVRWTVEAPFGRQRSWEMRLVEDEPGERVRWESTEAAKLPSDLTVTFESAPADRGTEVTVAVRWDPPAGAIGAALLDRLGIVPDSVVGSTLRRFKALAETGEVPTLENNPSGRGRGDLV